MLPLLFNKGLSGKVVHGHFGIAINITLIFYIPKNPLIKEAIPC